MSTELPKALPSIDRRVLAYGLPALGIALGGTFWLWAQYGLGVYFDSAFAFLAGCL